MTTEIRLTRSTAFVHDTLLGLMREPHPHVPSQLYMGATPAYSLRMRWPSEQGDLSRDITFRMEIQGIEGIVDGLCEIHNVRDQWSRGVFTLNHGDGQWAFFCEISPEGLVVMRAFAKGDTVWTRQDLRAGPEGGKDPGPFTVVSAQATPAFCMCYDFSAGHVEGCAAKAAELVGPQQLMLRWDRPGGRDVVGLQPSAAFVL